MVAAVALLATTAACKKSEPAPEGSATASASEAAASESAAPATAPVAGTYEVSDAAGKAVASVEVRADGGYTRTPVKGLAQSGVVKVTDGKTCFDPSGDEGPTCYVDSPMGADGTFTATMEDGSVLTVKKKA